MEDNLVSRIEGFLQRLTPGAVRGVDLACDFLLPLLSESSDPRLAGVVRALQVGCKLRTRKRRRRA